MPSIVTGQAIDRRPFLLVTADAKPHRMIHRPLRYGHLRQIAVAGRAFHVRADVGRVIETNVGFLDESIDALPWHVFIPLGILSQRLNSRIGRIADIFMTIHTDIDARNPGARALFHSGMASRAVHSDIDGMSFMRKIDRLLRLGLDIQKMFCGGAKTGVCRGKGRRTPSLGGIRIRRPAGVAGHARLLPTTKQDRRGGH